jgi:anti-anti-sigma factor
VLSSLDNFPIEWSDQCAVVRLPAEIDILNADQVSDTLLAVLNRGIAVLVADLTDTTFCSCAGITAVLRADRRARANGAQIRVATRSPAVLRLLALTGVDHLIEVFDSAADARDGLLVREGRRLHGTAADFGDHLAGNLPKLDIPVLGGGAQQAKRLGLGTPPLAHDDPDGLVDHGAGSQ